MAQPRPAIQTAAQELARLLRNNYTPAQALAEHARRHGELTPGEQRQALRWAQRLEVVRRAAENADPQAPLRDILGTYRPPGPEVDVPVVILIYQTKAEADANKPTRYRTVYERARWGETLQAVFDRAMTTFLEQEAEYGEPYRYRQGFASGFLFTGGYGATANQP